LTRGVQAVDLDELDATQANRAADHRELGRGDGARVADGEMLVDGEGVRLKARVLAAGPVAKVVVELASLLPRGRGVRERDKEGAPLAEKALHAECGAARERARQVVDDGLGRF